MSALGKTRKVLLLAHSLLGVHWLPLSPPDRLSEGRLEGGHVYGAPGFRTSVRHGGGGMEAGTLSP